MFNVGDLVKGKSDYYSITNGNMTKGLVVKIISSDYIKVKVLETTDETKKDAIGKAFEVNNDENDFEIIGNISEFYVKPQDNYIDKFNFDIERDSYVKVMKLADLKKAYGYYRTLNLINANDRLISFDEIKKLDGKEMKVNCVNGNGTIDIASKDGSYTTIPLAIVQKVKARKKKKAKVKKVDLEDKEIIEEMLKKVDRAKVAKIFASILKKNPKELLGVDKILENWAMAKKDLYILLGRELKIETEMEYDADKSFYEEKLKTLYPQYPFLNLLTYRLGGIDYLIDASKRDNFNYDFLANCGIGRGTKMSKVLSKLANDPNFDTDYSKILEQAKVKGKVVLSIDPVDFMLMSFNNSGWTSCHTISRNGDAFNWGEYSGGIFSYIADSCTIISYRHSGTKVDYKLGSNTIQDISKNWRELFYVDTTNGTFVASRQYPNYIEEISKVARAMLEKQISQMFGVEDDWKVSTHEGSSYYRTYMKDYRTGSYDNVLQYNDMLNGYKGKALYNKNIKDNFVMNIVVGGKAICPICGENELEHSSSIVCGDCD